MIKPKRQNALYLSGWILSFEWMKHEQLGGQTLACVVRSDRIKYGGHHTLYVKGDAANRLYIALSVFAVAAEFNRYDDIEKIPFEKLDDYFLMAAVEGVLYFNDLFALRVHCLNLTGRQRKRVDDLFEELRRRRGLTAMPHHRPVGPGVRP